MEYESEMSNAAFIKNHYYPGKLLRAGDFIREQEYVNRKLEFINRKFHGFGIVEGLDVHVEEDGVLHISEGSAIDLSGRIIIVPADVKVNVRKLDGQNAIPEHDFVLGIRYAERTSEEENSYLEPGKPYREARIEESFALKAYTWEDWENVKKSENENRKTLTEERVLFQDENVRLSVMVPKAVPSDSIFRCRIQARLLHGGSIGIGWQCVARLQGAFFAESGTADLPLEENDTVISGSVTREWEICTEDNRKYPITLELAHLKIKSGHFGVKDLETCQLCIETAPSYEDIMKKFLRPEKNSVRGKEPKQETDWLPLAYIKTSVSETGTSYAFAVSKEQNVRFSAFCPAWEQIYRQEAERSGIVDIRWRGVLKMLRRFLPQKPYEPSLPSPCEPLPPGLPEHVPPRPHSGVSKEQVQELVREEMEKKREQYIRRGIAVIPVPKRYRRGRILFSEEIAHGFAGEEVFLWCGRVFEEKNYAYWNRDKTRYSVLSGAESLFPDSKDSGWKIDRQAVRQNVEDGTFQVALTLSKGRRRNRSGEVAISWIAVKTI